MTSTTARTRVRRRHGGPRGRLHPDHESRYAPIRRMVAGEGGPVLVADERAGYDAGADDAAGGGVPWPEGPDPQPVGDLRAAVGVARAALLEVGRIAAVRGVSGGGELAGLAELVDTLDRGHAAALELVDRIESEGLSERRTGLPLENLLAVETR